MFGGPQHSDAGGICWSRGLAELAELAMQAAEVKGLSFEERQAKREEQLASLKEVRFKAGDLVFGGLRVLVLRLHWVLASGYRESNPDPGPGAKKADPARPSPQSTLSPARRSGSCSLKTDAPTHRNLGMTPLRVC